MKFVVIAKEGFPGVKSGEVEVFEALSVIDNVPNRAAAMKVYRDFLTGRNVQDAFMTSDEVFHSQIFLMRIDHLTVLNEQK